MVSPLAPLATPIIRKPRGYPVMEPGDLVHSRGLG